MASNAVPDLAYMTGRFAASAAGGAAGDYGGALAGEDDGEEAVGDGAGWAVQDEVGASGGADRDGEVEQTVDIGRDVELADSDSGWRWDCKWTGWACRRIHSVPEEEGWHVEDADGQPGSNSRDGRDSATRDETSPGAEEYHDEDRRRPHCGGVVRPTVRG